MESQFWEKLIYEKDYKRQSTIVLFIDLFCKKTQYVFSIKEGQGCSLHTPTISLLAMKTRAL